MFGLGIPEIGVILIIALIIFGPKRLPEIGEALGRGLRELKQSADDIKKDVESTVGFSDIKKDIEAMGTDINDFQKDIRSTVSLDKESQKEIKEALNIEGVTTPLHRPVSESKPQAKIADDTEKAAVGEDRENIVPAVDEKNSEPEKPVPAGEEAKTGS